MVILKTPEEIALMRESGRRLAKVIQNLKTEVKVGVRTDYLDKRAKELIEAEGCTSAFLGYQPSGTDKPFPFTACVSINDTVVHGLPSGYEIKDGDLVKLDLGLIYEKFYSDSAITIPVGNVSPEAERLIKITWESLNHAIQAAKPGNTLGDIGNAVESFVKKEGFGIVKTLTGHGIGRRLHEDPYVFNFGQPGEGEELVPGMVLALEPMINLGSGRVKQKNDDSFVTADGSLSAHFEHTIAITKDGPKVLTVL